MSYAFREETTICQVLLSIRVSEQRETVGTCLLLLKKRKKTFATPSHDGMTSSQPASSLLVFFYFCFHSPRVAWGKRDVHSRFSAGLKPNWPMAGWQIEYGALSRFLWRCIVFSQIYLLLLARRGKMCCYLPIVRSSFSNFTSIHHLSRPRG